MQCILLDTNSLSDSLDPAFYLLWTARFLICLTSKSTTCDNYVIFSILFLDLNECAQGRPCQHICINNPGSYRCRCYPCYKKRGTRCYLEKCKINGACYNYGEVNPYNQCQVKILILRCLNSNVR